LDERKGVLPLKTCCRYTENVVFGDPKVSLLGDLIRLGLTKGKKDGWQKQCVLVHEHINGIVWCRPRAVNALRLRR